MEKRLATDEMIGVRIPMRLQNKVNCPSGQGMVCKTIYIGSNPIFTSVIDARVVEH